MDGRTFLQSAASFTGAALIGQAPAIVTRIAPGRRGRSA